MILKPLDVGEILDNTIGLFREQYKSYLSFAALGAGLWVGVVILGIFLGIVLSLIWREAIYIAVIAMVIMGIALYLTIIGGLVAMASGQILGRPIGVREAWQAGKGKIGPLFAAGLIYGVAVAGGFLLLVIPGIYMAICFALFMQTTVIENQEVGAALSRSRALVSGSWWRCLGILTLIGVLVWVLTGIISWPLQLALRWGLGEVGAFLASIVDLACSCLFMPFSVLASTLLYYDLRVRKENLDVRLMVDSLTGQALPDK